MSFIYYIFRRLKNFFSTTNSHTVTDLESVLGESHTPSLDPNRGTVFWTGTESPRLRKRIIYLGGFALIIATVFVLQLWKLQIQQGAAFAIESTQNTLSQTPLFSQRGTITDRNDTSLAWSTATSSRSYFLRSYASSSPSLGHVLGYVKYPARDDNGNFYRQQIEGQAGLESGFQEYLEGEIGTKIVESTALGKPVSESIINPPKEGQDLRLSIDLAVQEQLFSLLEHTSEEYGFVDGGAGVIMDIHSGEVLAAANYPVYDPQSLTNGDPDYIEELTTAYNQPFLNRVSAGRFTPGSVVKPFIAAAALAEGVITPQTVIVSTGLLRVENPYRPGTYSVFPDWKEHGSVTVRDALAVSSNEFFYQIGGGYENQPGIGIDNIASYSRAFGLGEKTGIVGLSETEGVIPTPAWKEANFTDGIWRLGDTYHTAIGQYGYQVTPLSMVRAVAGIATAGTLPTPTLLRDNKPETESIDKPISPADYRVVQEGMRAAVAREDGTAHNLDVSYLDIAAKTGTAELGGDSSGLNSWIVGFWPYEDPQYAFTVVMANGSRSNVVGGLYVMRRLFDWMHRDYPRYIE